VVGEGARGAAVIAGQPVNDPQDQRRRRARALARSYSPAACTYAILADAPGVRHAAELLNASNPLPPELTAGLFGFGVGLICGFALCYFPPKDPP
jgi:hypothetical protein